MSEHTMEKLRQAIDHHADAVLMGTRDELVSSARSLNAELKAVESKLAELERLCPDCRSPMPGEMCAVCVLAHAEAELVELRKRPTLEEIGAAVNAATNGDYLSYTNEYQRARSVVLEAVAALYAEKNAVAKSHPS